MFDVDVRESVSASILEVVSRDPWVMAGAVVGSLALTSGDRFSDVDLSFAIRDGIDLRTVLDDWTALFASDNEIDVLFDLVVRREKGLTYRRRALYVALIRRALLSQHDLEMQMWSSLGVGLGAQR